MQPNVFKITLALLFLVGCGSAPAASRPTAPVELAPPPTVDQTSVAATAFSATATANLVNVPPTATTIPPTATPAAPTGNVLRESKVYSLPGGQGVDLGEVCIADAVQFLDQHHAPGDHWYKIRRLTPGQVCGRPVAPGTEGWVSDAALTEPSVPLPTSAQLSVGTSESPAPAATDTPQAIVIITHGGNLRLTPDFTEQNILGQVCPGDHLLVSEQAPDWLHIHVLDRVADCVNAHAPVGAQGWVSDALIAPQPGTNQKRQIVSAPAAPTSPVLASPASGASSSSVPSSGGGSLCSDGTASSSSGRGTCSHHGGVSGGHHHK